MCGSNLRSYKAMLPIYLQPNYMYIVQDDGMLEPWKDPKCYNIRTCEGDHLGMLFSFSSFPPSMVATVNFLSVGASKHIEGSIEVWKLAGAESHGI